MGCSPSVIIVKFEARGPYDEVRFLERERRNLDKYFYHLSAKLLNKHTQEETIHIRDAVERSVRQILDSVAIVDGRFRLKQENALLTVGSFYEGDQITDTYRFDLIVILDGFGPNVVDLEVGNKRNGSLPVQIIMNGGGKAAKQFGNKWKGVLDGDTFVGSRNGVVKKDGLLDKFVKRLKYVSTFFTPRSTKFGVLNIPEENAIRKEGNFVVVKFLLTNIFGRRYGLQVSEESSYRAIYVTLTPAIKWDGVCDYIYPHDFHFQRMYDAILKSGTFLVVPSSDGYFKIAFTETETSFLRQMSQKHKRALCVVKFLLKGDRSVFETKGVSKYALFDSYSIKMIMLALEETCPCNRDSSEYDLYECVIHVMKVVHAGLHNHCAIYSYDWDTSDEVNNPELDVPDRGSYAQDVNENGSGSYILNEDVSRSYVEITDKTFKGVDVNNTRDIDESSHVDMHAGDPDEEADDTVDDVNENIDGITVLRSNSADISLASEGNKRETDKGGDIDTDKESLNENPQYPTRPLSIIGPVSKRRNNVALTLDQRWIETDDDPDVRSETESDIVPLEYDILRLLSPEMRLKVNETSLYVNCANCYELMKHDLKYWIGQRERYNLSLAVPNYGVTCLQEKIKKNTVNN